MFSCPVPYDDSDRVSLACGGGGLLMNRLLEEVFFPAFGTDSSSLHDSSLRSVPGGTLAMTTDSFVVHPLVFPGGDIGSLAVHGTTNDLAMSGARPLYLSAGFILEEGLEVAVLKRIVKSMARAASELGVSIVTGDTKVVEKGKCDGVYINTCGIGSPEYPGLIAPSSIREGDAVIVSGDLGRHGMTIMSVREGLGFSSSLESDSAPLWPSVDALIRSGADIHCLRDITRGGLTTTLNEIADSSGLGIVLDEASIPVCDEVRSACDVLGLDPLQVACEGRFLAIVPADAAARTLAALRSVPVSSGACVVGRVERRTAAPLVMNGVMGVRRILGMPSGAQLPRIC